MKSFLTSLIIVLSTVAHSAELQIVNEANQPIVGAEIFIGDSIEAPLLTDVNGSISIPSKWGRALPVTITAAGYLRTTFLNLSPIDNVLQMHRAESKNLMEVKGNSTNYVDLKRDGKVDFSLVYPGFSRSQLAQLDIQSVISSDIDIINIVTESIAIPSNLSIPNQKESYMIPITVDKPLYRMTLKQTGNYRMMATHGQFPIKQVAGDFRNGKSFFEVINHFRFLSGGQRDVTVNGPLDGQDIPVNQINYDAKTSVMAPQFGTDKAMFSFTVIHQGDLFFPADVKRVYPGEAIELAMPSTSEKNSLVNILMPLSEAKKIGGGQPDTATTQIPKPDEIIGSLKMLFTQFMNLVGEENPGLEGSPINMGMGGLSMAQTALGEGAPQFLDLIPRPTIADNIVTVLTPQAIDGIEPLATYVMLSEVETKHKNNYDLETVFKVWEVTQLGWAGQLELPASQFNLTPGVHYRLEVLFMGRKVGHNNNSGGYFLDGVTHVSRNSFDIK